MEEKITQFNRSKNKIISLSWTSPIYQHGEGRYQHKTFKDNIPGYPGYYISKRGKIYPKEVKYIQDGILMVRVY